MIEASSRKEDKAKDQTKKANAAKPNQTVQCFHSKAKGFASLGICFAEIGIPRHFVLKNS
jgi:hypothetical protein